MSKIEEEEVIILPKVNKQSKFAKRSLLWTEQFAPQTIK